MDCNAQLDHLLEGMVTDYLERNGAAKLLKETLAQIGIGFWPVIDHLTLRTKGIDRRAEPFVALGYAYDETIEFEDWYAKVYRKAGYPALFID